MADFSTPPKGLKMYTQALFTGQRDSLYGPNKAANKRTCLSKVPARKPKYTNKTF